MKQALIIIILGLGLIGLSACSFNRSPLVDEKKSDNKLDMAEAEKEAPQDVALTDGLYRLDPLNSKFVWHGEKVIGKGHTGTVAFASGNLEIRENKLSGGEFIVDLSSLKNDENIEALDNHLKSADFFDVANYPTAKLLITKAEPEEDGNYMIAADLSIKDVTVPVSFKAKLEPEGEAVSAKAEFTIDRTLWGLKYGSGKFFQNLGDNMINDEIEFSISLLANRDNQ